MIDKKSTIQRRKKSLLCAGLKYLILLIASAIMFLPFFWLFSASLMTPRELIAIPPKWVPTVPQWHNYPEVFKRIPIFLYYKNSLIVAVSVTLLVLFTSSTAGYAFAKLRFPGRSSLFRFILITMMFPGFLFIVPVYYILKRFPLLGGNNIFGMGGSGALNSHLALILPFTASGYGIFLMRQFIMTIPDELLDAARVDGASEFLIFARIVLPLTKPALASLALFTFISQWNSFLWPLIVTSARPYLITLPVGIQRLSLTFSTNIPENQHLIMAGLVLQVIPAVLVFLYLQRYYIKGVVLSGFGGL